MKIFKTTILLVIIISFFNCASSYKAINPNGINYLSVNETAGVKLEYKYDLLDKKYAKKEDRKGIKLIAVKITNNSNKDLTFGRDLNLTYENGSSIFIMDQEKTFKYLKQSPATHLFYLLLTPVNLYTTKPRSGYQETTSSTPIGLILGPGLAAGNMIVASSANKKFKTEISKFNIYGSLIRKGETKYGLVGIKSDSFDALKLKIN